LLCLIIYSSFYFIVNWCVVICLRFVTAIFYMNLVFVFFFVIFVGMLVLAWLVIIWCIWSWPCLIKMHCDSSPKLRRTNTINIQ
jgi:hypothetical protein